MGKLTSAIELRKLGSKLGFETDNKIIENWERSFIIRDQIGNYIFCCNVVTEGIFQQGKILSDPRSGKVILAFISPDTGTLLPQDMRYVNGEIEPDVDWIFTRPDQSQRIEISRKPRTVSRDRSDAALDVADFALALKQITEGEVQVTPRLLRD